MARTKKGKWLTEHDLRSGLREQWASSTKTVELYWDRDSDRFLVTSQRPTYNGYFFATPFTSLEPARELFRTLVRNERLLKKGRSRP